MGCLLGVSQGSNEPLQFLEMHYNGGGNTNTNQKPLVLVGKGVTFDSGGISNKPSEGMGLMKGDMGGAGISNIIVFRSNPFQFLSISVVSNDLYLLLLLSVILIAAVAATIKAIASLRIPVNVIGLTPLCENMPSGHATKPGDVLVSMKGTTVEVDNTDAGTILYSHSDYIKSN